MLKWQELSIQKHFEDAFHSGLCIISHQNFVLLIEIRLSSPMLVSIRSSRTPKVSKYRGFLIRLNLIDPLDGVFKARTSFNRPGVYLDLTIQDGLADLTIKPSYIKLNFASKEYIASCTR